MKIYQHPNWLSADLQACIKPLPFILIKVELEKEREISIIKVKMLIKPVTTTSERYNINMSTFEDRQPEEFLALLKNFMITIDGTGMMSASGLFNYLRKMLCVKSLREFDKLSGQNSGTTNFHLKHITEGLIGYFPLINTLFK